MHTSGSSQGQGAWLMWWQAVSVFWVSCSCMQKLVKERVATGSLWWPDEVHLALAKFTRTFSPKLIPQNMVAVEDMVCRQQQQQQQQKQLVHMVSVCLLVEQGTLCLCAWWMGVECDG